ncbi:MAG: hypothetical protein IJT15_00040 [Rickettsiales bacterium]|nr:hypothetical protein [Rickettsiales bacterium]
MNEINNGEQIENNRFYEKIKVLTEQYKNNSDDKDDTWGKIGEATNDYIDHISQNRDIFSTVLSSIIQKRYKTVIEQKQQDHKNLTDQIKDKVCKRYFGGIVSTVSGILTTSGGLTVVLSLPAASICGVGCGAVLAGCACIKAGSHLCSLADSIGKYSFEDELISIQKEINELQQDIKETGDKQSNDIGQNGHTIFHNRFHIVYKLNDLRRRCDALYNLLDDLAKDDIIEMTKDDVVELLDSLFAVHSVEEQLNSFEAKNNGIAGNNLNDGVQTKDINKSNI